MGMGTFTQCVLQPKALATTRGSVRKWIPTRKKKFSMRSRMANLGWIQTQKQMLKKSKKNIRRSKESARRSFPSTMVLVVAVVAAVKPRKTRKKRMMSCKTTETNFAHRLTEHLCSLFLSFDVSSELPMYA